MNTNNYPTGADPLNTTLEQFDALDANHVFSDGYQARKQALLAEVGQAGVQAAMQQKATQRTAVRNAQPDTTAHTKQQARHVRRFSWKVAAAVAAICVALPAGAWAITSHADFFAGAFGDGWRTSQPAEQAFQDQRGTKAPVPVVYPASEVVQLDAEAAEALLGDAVCDETVTVNAPDGHELTITSAVRSENTLAYRFTLHRDGGVTCLYWDEHTNNVAAKGAHIAPGAQFSWAAAGDEFVYIDPTASTVDTLVGYAYSVLGEPVPAGQPISLTVYTWDVPFEDSTEEQFHMQQLDIQCTSPVASSTFASAEGSTVTISPLGLSLEQRALFPEPTEADAYDMAQDPANVRRITVSMDDGTIYTVFNKAENLDNTLSACGFDTSLSIAFNRLVDPAHITSIEADVTDVHDMDKLHDANGNWVSDADWPVRTVTYTRA